MTEVRITRGVVMADGEYHADELAYVFEQLRATEPLAPRRREWAECAALVRNLGAGLAEARAREREAQRV